MFKYLLVVMLLLTILPVNAFDVTTCPICPAPQFVYVTVTPLPTPAPTQQVVYVNVPVEQTAPQQGYLISNTQMKIFEYGALAIIVILILTGISIFIQRRRRKNKAKQPRKLIITKNIDELFEETEDEPEPEPIPEPIPEKKKFKSPKKGKSLLDQDFEF